MVKSRGSIQLLAFFLTTALIASSQTPSEWRVKPEWVQAHEMFLASDAMRGRGSATPDELIAATYVASEFEQYGLKPGMPDGSFIQRVELIEPVIEGKVTITAPENSGFTALEEGKDFSLMRASGESLSGPLEKLSGGDLTNAQVRPGSVILLSGDMGPQGSAFIRRALIGGARAILRVDPSLTADQLENNLDHRPPVHPSIAGVSQAMLGGKINVILVTKDAGTRIAQLSDGTTLSLQMQTKNTPRYSYNAVGVLAGRNSGPEANVVLLSAHLDHLGIARPVDGDSIYNGANDDASGTTAVMELAHALAAGPAPQRTIYFVCYGSEELGGLGSTYFREHSPVPLDRIAANLEFEMIGNQDPKMPKGKLLLTGWDRSNLGPTLAQHGALLGDDPYPEQHFFERSDNYPLALKGVVAHTAAGWGTPPTYHQPNDDLAHLDFQFMTEAIQSLIEPVRWLANSDFVPQWLPGKQPQQRR